MRKQVAISITFINNPGFIIRVALILERRGFTIQSLKVTDEISGQSRLDLLTMGDPLKKDQVIKQIEKLIDVKSLKGLVRPETKGRSNGRNIFVFSEQGNDPIEI
jgi:acetolactate synthase small subunit